MRAYVHRLFAFWIISDCRKFSSYIPNLYTSELVVEFLFDHINHVIDFPLQLILNAVLVNN